MFKMMEKRRKMRISSFLRGLGALGMLRGDLWCGQHEAHALREGRESLLKSKEEKQINLKKEFTSKLLRIYLTFLKDVRFSKLFTLTI